jgi:hypothetical protein
VLHPFHRAFTLLEGCDWPVEPILSTDESPVLNIEGKCSCERAKPAHFVGHLPTSAHVQQLATTHRRMLPELSEQFFPPAPSAPSNPSDVSAASVCASVVSEVSGLITQLTQQLGSLQAQVALLQQQLALLTEHLQKERQGCTSVIKAFENTSLDKPAESSLDKAAIPASIDRRKHPRVLPLVEYGVQGNYVVISPEEGLLSFVPDSPEWFAWLSTLPSFRFVGQQGRFTAFRGYECSPHTPWWAHRQIRNHSHKRRLGLTASVTIASLELAATSLQALV